MDKEIEQFANDWCKKNNVTIENLSAEQVNQICSDWAIKSLGIQFKTLEEWKKEYE